MLEWPHWHISMLEAYGQGWLGRSSLLGNTTATWHKLGLPLLFCDGISIFLVILIWLSEHQKAKIKKAGCIGLETCTHI